MLQKSRYRIGCVIKKGIGENNKKLYPNHIKIIYTHKNNNKKLGHVVDEIKKLGNIRSPILNF